MNFQGNFKDIGRVDIAPIRDLVVQLTSADWNRENARQKKFEAHQDTQFIGLVYDTDFRHMQATQQPALKLFGPVLHPVFKMIAEQYEAAPETLLTFNEPVQGYFVRVSLVKLLAGGKISPHRDMGFSLTHSHRIHVPILTNENVKFSVGSETRNLKAGEITEINNRRYHAVINQGETDRVHLILDWVFPWEPCCCADKVHPGERCTPEACYETYMPGHQCECYPEQV